MREALEKIAHKYEVLNARLAEGSLASQREEYVKTVREVQALEPLIAAWKALRECQDRQVQARELLSGAGDDGDLRAMAEEELGAEAERERGLTEEIRGLMLPRDPRDDRNVILEIRAGTGGDEASLFVGDLYRMYSRFADQRGWKMEPMSMSEGTAGGFKEIACLVAGQGAYGCLKFESGTHRVQRVPETEANGRIHTSAVTVAVLPEVEESEVVVKEDELKIDTYRSGGAGGQHVNKTESAIRITHLPTGLVVTCQDERSQHKNKAKAMKLLRARLGEAQRQAAADAHAADRKSQVGTGDRSERQRTYNFPQNRLTDHRVNLTLHSLDRVMEGDLGAVLDALKLKDRQERMAEFGGGAA